MSTPSVSLEHSDDSRAKKNVLILFIAQALYGGGTSIMITLGGLVGHQLAVDKGLATLPITTFVLGTALMTVPASMYMKLVGRRLGFMTGSAFGVASGALATYAIFQNSFWLFCLGTFLGGTYQASSMYYRFAATDTASEGFKAKAISWVLAGGIVAAFIGPQLVIYTKALFSPVLFAGSYASATMLSLLALAVVSFIDIPKPSAERHLEAARPLGTIMRQPRLLIAMFCGMVSFGIMNFVMTATPLAMVACGLTVDDAAFVIQWHIVAMFAPSFFTGHLINRFGKERVIGFGLILLAGCGVVALSGIDLTHFWFALVLLGLGWNFGFVGATALVTDCYRPSERNKVQAANDLCVFGMVAFASFSSGKLLHLVGWDAVAGGLFPFVALAFLLIGWLYFQGRMHPA